MICELVDGFKEKYFALTATKAIGHFSTHAATDLNRVSLFFSDVDIPIGKLGGIKVGNFSDCYVRAEIVILPNIDAFVECVDVIEEGRLSGSGTANNVFAKQQD